MTERIEVKLTEAGKTALGTTDEWAVLDLDSPIQSKISLTKDIEQLTVENQINLEGVFPFTIPRTTRNDALLLPFANPMSLDNKTVGIECQVWKNLIPLSYNLIYYRSKNAQTWELEFRTNLDHWSVAASTKRICTITLPERTINSQLDDDWIYPAYNPDPLAVGGQKPDRWAPIDFGGWVDLAEPIQLTDPPQKQVWLEDLRPVFSEPYLLKQGFCEIGWNLEGKIFETDEVRRMWTYLISPEYYLKSKGGLHKLQGYGTLVPQPALNYPLLILGGIDYDPGTHALNNLVGPGFLAGLINNLPYKTTYKFCFNGYVQNTGGVTNTLKFGIIQFVVGSGPSGLFFQDGDFSVELTAGEIKYISFCTDVVIPTGDAAALSFDGGDVQINAGFRFSVEPNQKSLIRGDTVKLGQLIDCQYFLLDLFKGFLHKVNGLIETNHVTRTITVLPAKDALIRGETVDGFVKPNEPIDITDKIICESIKLTPLRSSQTKYTRYSFQRSTDAYIDSLSLPEPAYSRKTFNGEELNDSTTEIQNPFFEPTLERQSIVLKRRLVLTANAPYYLEVPFLPVITDNLNGERSFTGGPRSLYALGFGRQNNPTDNTAANFYFEGVAGANFLYLSQRNTWFFRNADATPGNPARLVYGTLEGDLFSVFYLGSSLTLRKGTQVDALVLMTDENFQDWNFREPFRFLYEGFPIECQGVKFQDHAPPLSTPVTFYVPPSETECCDRPCSCQFSQCLYWQDFGQYIGQATLDALSITSFKVNGIQQLDAPVEFGILKIQGVYGQPYVTNLVDALNSIGAPYFTFDYSGKTSTKKDGRFFSIKRPICFNFEIKISNAIGVVYFYSESQQWQSVFGVEAAMGYGVDVFSAPIECVTTIEY